MRHLIFLALVCLLAACAPIEGTPAERIASFAPYERAKIRNHSAADYLLARTAWVAAGANLQLLPQKRNTDTKINIRLRLNSPGLRFGTASAIDRRGYFLTAAHNMNGPVCYVAFYKHGIRLMPARAVWVGNEGKGEPDVALICVDESLEAAFPWADLPAHDTPALSGGLDADKKYNFELVSTGGSVLRVTNRRRSSVPWSIIMHDTPLHHGDSGGPLVTREGRLLGINTEVYPVDPFRLPRIKRSSAAHRPDPDFVRRLIESDIATRRTGR